MNFSKQLIMEIGIDNCRHLADFVVGFIWGGHRQQV